LDFVVGETELTAARRYIFVARLINCDLEGRSTQRRHKPTLLDFVRGRRSHLTAFLELNRRFALAANWAWQPNEIFFKISASTKWISTLKRRTFPRQLLPEVRNFRINTAQKKKGRTMNPLIQLNRQLQYLFIAVLLACFAIPAMGERDKTPNHKEIIINSIRQVLCASEQVDLRGELKLKFEDREIFGIR
jgi:hypothetical protein